MLTSSKQDNELVLAKTFSRDFDANLAKGYLADNGIEVIITNEIFASLYPIGFNSVGGLRLMVRGRDLERALALLDEMSFSDD